MSGIAEIKKKTKLSMDEMYENQSIAKMDNQEEIKPEIKQIAIQLEDSTDDKIINSPSENTYNPENQKAGKTSIRFPGKIDNHMSQQEFEPNRQITQFSNAKQQIQKIPTYKMTFNLTEDIYKAFNDLYAKRMLQGRKTEKSEMICEAIQWLIKMEGVPTE